MKKLLVTKCVDEIDHVATGKNVKAHRNVIANRSLRYVAHQMGISTSYLCDLELGRRHWTAELVARYEQAVKP